jgi:hypothetical protein
LESVGHGLTLVYSSGYVVAELLNQAGNHKQRMPEFRQEYKAGGQVKWNVYDSVISLCGRVLYFVQMSGNFVLIFFQKDRYLF